METSPFKKGDVFEKKVFGLIENLLKSDSFFVPGKRSSIFHKKGYYSQSRENEIVFDIAIETTLENAPTFSILTIVECKNYSHAVPVNDIEEFSAKLSQIGTHRTKGVLIATNKFQEGAIKYAKNHGISLAIIKGNSEIEWVNYRINRKADYTEEQIELAFETDNSERRFLAYCKGNLVEDIGTLLVSLEIIDFYFQKEEYIKIPYRSVDDINEIIARLSKQNIYNKNKLDHEALCQLMSEWYDADFVFDKELFSNKNIPLLGKTSFDPLVVYVNKNLKDDINRWRFTLAHEIGHLIMHKGIFEQVLKEREEDDYSISLKFSTSRKAFSYAENQANVFAGGILMPYKQFLLFTKTYFIQNRIYKDYMYVDSQPQNYKAEKRLLDTLSNEFAVSKEAARIRLLQFNMLKTENDFSISTYMRRNPFY